MTLATPPPSRLRAGAAARTGAASRVVPAAARWRLALFLAVATAGDVLFDPVHRHVPLCPFHAVTGWDCPLCGGLRAVAHLAHGQIGAALRANVLVVAAIPLFALWWVDGLNRSRRGLAARRPGRVGVIALVALAVVYTVLRNLPGMAALRP